MSNARQFQAIKINIKMWCGGLSSSCVVCSVGVRCVVEAEETVVVVVVGVMCLRR